MAKAPVPTGDVARKQILSTIVKDFLESSSESEDDIYQLAAVDSDSDDEAIFQKIVQVYGKDPLIPKDKTQVNYKTKGGATITMSEYSTEEFLQNFRITKDLYENLVRRYEDSSEFKSLRAFNRLPASLHIEVFLWFAGREGCRFRHVSKRFNIPTSSVSRVMDRMTVFVHSLSEEAISWPTAEERQESANYFEQQFGFGKAMGCIDVTHLAIDTSTKDANDYINSKGNITLCMQAVCDAQKRFINTYIKCPGSRQPTDILHNSPIYEEIGTLCEDYYLLGPSSYPCSDWILTPFEKSDRLESDQKYFNQQHMRAHGTIRQAFSALKQRFQQLKYCKIRGHQKLCNFIEACCVLHNLSIGDDFEISNMINDDGYIDEVRATEPDINDDTRTLICDELWQKRKNFS